MGREANGYCDRLGISVPSLEATRNHPAANTYALLVVTLLEHGRPMTLDEVALKFEAAGVVAHADDAYFALKRCRPARPPVTEQFVYYRVRPRAKRIEVVALWSATRELDPPLPK
jgi:hypothetical protein